MDKVLHVKFVTIKDYYGDECGHKLYSPDSRTFGFSVHNLCEYPEDATIYRDLFNGHDYLEAIKLGMDLAREGYTSIEVTDAEDEEY